MNSSGNNSLANILIVDDEPNNLRVLSTILTEGGYQARSVLNGPMALRAAQSSPPDLILLDIMMPQMDGYQVCEHLKNDPSTKDIPVIFLSAKDQAADKVKAFAVGAVDYISKPFQIEEVMARVEHHLRLCKLQQQLAQQNCLLQEEIRQRQVAEEALKQQNSLLQKEIKERQKAEAALEKSNQDLMRSNAELEKFASIASHDLRSPLSSILAYSQLLKISCSESMNEESQHYTQRIIDASNHMIMLIQDLLEYCHVEQVQEPFALIDCNQVLQEVCKNLSADISKNQAVITSDILPALMGNRSQLGQVFQNIVSNAIKYRQEAPPEIHVSFAMEKERCIFSVKDNGIGIEAEYFQKIFEMFKRLHNRKTYAGTGIGLAICQKIVELHGGQIWVESEPGKGSIFYFTLPVGVAEIETTETFLLTNYFN